MKKNLTSILIAFGMCNLGIAQTLTTGPSSSQSPYFLPVTAGYSVTSILTAADVVAGYTMSGIPDGLGAYDNNDGTFTLLMNHEIATPGGAIRAHGSNGAFVSKWVINKTTLAVTSGADLTQNVNLWNPSTSTYSTYNATTPSTLAALSRFCSADLPAVTAYYNSVTGKGTQERIFMNGEESGNEGRLFAHIATGANAGKTYELPYLGKFSCENACANPHRSDKTIVIGMDDTTPGQVYVYVGYKSTIGTEINKAGLSGGTLYGVAVSGLLNETSASIPTANTTFSLINLGAIQSVTGSSLNTISNNLGVTNFLRPEDGCWDPSRPTDFYFNTTNAFNSPSRVWRLRFNDVENPELGGTITAVLDGTEGQQMLDNMTIDNSGHILLCEDVGNNAHNGKIWEYTIATDALVQVGQHDPSRFITGGANFLTQDEETSGIVDVQAILGPGKFLFVTQAHYSIPGAVYEGGQLMLLTSLNTATSNPEANVQGNSTSIPAGNTAISTTNNTDFGALNLGNSVNKTFIIQNTGTGVLTISSMNITGANAGDFTFVSPPAYPVTIAANGSQSFTVKYTPVILGTSNAVINIFNNDLNESIYDFAVRGNGVAPEINIQGNSVTILDGNTAVSSNDNTDFGSVIYNTSVTKTFLIQNTGTGTLTVSGMSLTGTNANAFSFVTPPSFPLTLAANTSQTFAVQFLPTTAPSTNVASIVIGSDDSNEASYDFTIQGKGLMDVGISNFSKTESSITLYPNPAKDEVTLNIMLDNSEMSTVTVFDIQGKKVLNTIEKQLEKGENSMNINTSSLKSGEYFVQINTGNKVNKIKLIVNH